MPGVPKSACSLQQPLEKGHLHCRLTDTEAPSPPHRRRILALIKTRLHTTGTVQNVAC